MEVNYTPSFIRQFNKLNKNLQEEVLEKIELFKNKDNHIKLKVHALNAKFEGSYSFSINYSHRIIFDFISKKEVVLTDVGDHDIYK
jgi:mRNA-degrading endonuclease YafQ of YafQ-DinJ toxin-antitoxin module